MGCDTPLKDSPAEFCTSKTTFLRMKEKKST